MLRARGRWLAKAPSRIWAEGVDASGELLPEAIDRTVAQVAGTALLMHVRSIA